MLASWTLGLAHSSDIVSQWQSGANIFVWPPLSSHDDACCLIHNCIEDGLRVLAKNHDNYSPGVALMGERIFPFKKFRDRQRAMVTGRFHNLLVWDQHRDSLRVTSSCSTWVCLIRSVLLIHLPACHGPVGHGLMKWHSLEQFVL